MQEAAQEARYIKDKLSQELGAPVFLDSDDLADLRQLCDIVMECDVLILFLTRDLMTRDPVARDQVTGTEVERERRVVLFEQGSERQPADHRDRRIYACAPGSVRLDPCADWHRQVTRQGKGI